MDEEDGAVFYPPYSFGWEMERITQQMNLIRDQIITQFGIPAVEALRHLNQAMRSDMPRQTRRFRNLREMISNDFPAPYEPAEGEAPLAPEAAQEATADGELLNRTRGVIPPMQHDLRPVRQGAYCGRCNEPAIVRCYTIGCRFKNIMLCPKHLHEEHDGRTLPEGVPHD